MNRVQLTSQSSRGSNKKDKNKIVFCGEDFVGKTSIIKAFHDDGIEDQYKPTVGIDFQAHTHRVSGQNHKLLLWDTAGSKRYRSLVPVYLKTCTGAVVVYAVDDRKSFDAVGGWIKRIKALRSMRESSEMAISLGRRRTPPVMASPKTEAAKNEEEGVLPPPFMILVGNKCDVAADDRKVTVEEGQAHAKTLGIQFIETSAKEGTNINDLFDLACTKILDSKHGGTDPSHTQNEDRLKVHSANPCCGVCCKDKGCVVM